MNKQGILRRVLQKISLSNAIEIIQERNLSWSPSRVPRKKADIEEDFVELSDLISDDEIEDFVEMAVMKKMIGLPAYTYKVVSLDFLNGKEEEELNAEISTYDHPFGENFTVSTQITENSASELKIKFRIKEYQDRWKTGELNLESLSAVFTYHVTLNKLNGVLTIYSGNYTVGQIIKNYLSTICKWPLEPYRLNYFSNQVIQLGLGNASFNTCLILDFIYNRLKDKGVEANFKEIKFKKNKRTDGIKTVTINGQDLLTSQLACEYITLGSDIISFKLAMTFENRSFSTICFLHGEKNDIMKIVIVDVNDELFKHRIINLIQEEYINLCNGGIKDIPATKERIESIYQKFLIKDELVNQAIQKNTLDAAASIAKIVDKFEELDKEVIYNLSQFAESIKSILDSIGYAENNSSIEMILEFVGNDDSLEDEVEDLIAPTEETPE